MYTLLVNIYSIDMNVYTKLTSQSIKVIMSKVIGLVYIVKTLIRVLSLMRINALVQVRLHQMY